MTEGTQGASKGAAAETRGDTREFFANAEAFYRLLGSMFYLELTEEQIQGLARSGFDYPEDGTQMAQGCREIRTYLDRRGANARRDLAVDYARIFLAAGIHEGETAVPFESVYTSDEGILMQDSRDDVVRVYRANGLVVPTDLNVPEDHLAFELEFMAHVSGRIAARLSAGEPADDALAVQRAFIDEHLLNWLPLLQERVEKHAKLAFYPALVKIARSFIEENRIVVEEALR
ncbi:TorD/DmsD family molecular chaperone [Arabiibacter massiliensis]|uniref:TorD/DmsD family molecular chaperone n=1 Tax=Arabiibacter massiliensis TaxID=1870985 RepID=UPI00117B6793|nr:molecular chaperone TorD family protein [Arabiibacter massiliensis]